MPNLRLALLRYWAPFLIYCALILFLSTRPSTDLPKLNAPDKLLHLAEYSLYGALLFRVLWRNLHWHSAKAVAGTLLGVAVFGLLDESVQSFVPSRDFSLLDWTADMAGALLGIGFYWVTRTVWEKVRT